MSTDRPALTVRPGTSHDAGALAEVFLAAREAAYPAMPRPVHPPAEIRAWLGRLTTGGLATREIWLAEQDGTVVGYAHVEADWLDSLYVRPGLTGQGVGSMLLGLVKGLRPDGFALWVFETNARARTFYRRHGLLELEHTDGSTNEERAPDLRMAWPGARPVAYLREQIDDVDDDLSRALARRAALTAAVQAHKDVAGHAGRDRAREAQIVARMARHAPGLGHARLARIMEAVIAESLDAAAAPDGPMGPTTGPGEE
jgi:chorismate mutase/GNAT superfamily N-acetyltransferase